MPRGIDLIGHFGPPKKGPPIQKTTLALKDRGELSLTIRRPKFQIGGG